MKKVIIVGGGIGGLCSAIRMLHLKYKVILLEKESTLGGKINRLENEDFKFDLTASLPMTPHIYKDIFNDVGKRAEDYLEFIKLDKTYRVYYYDNTMYDFYSNEEKMIKSLENIDKNLSKNYFDLINKSYEKYLISKKEFLDKPMISIKENIHLSLIKDLIKINPINDSNDYIEDKIANEKIRQFLIFQSMYIGVNPYENSNIYTLIPAITQVEGLTYIKGGMYEYILALKKLILELGGEIQLNSNVENIIIRNNKAIGIKTSKKEIYGDVIICNADYPYAIKNLVNVDINEGKYNKNSIDKMNFSCSVFMLYLGLNKKCESIKLHNIYINENFKKNLEDAFKNKIPKQPSLYIYSPSAIDASICKEGCSTLNIMIRVPNLSCKNIVWNNETIKELRDTTINTLKKINGLEDIDEYIVKEEYLTPLDLEKKFNAYYGSAFGLGHNLLQSAYLRPHMKCSSINNLYFIGSSTHPGNGTSVIIEGSKVLAQIINDDIK